MGMAYGVGGTAFNISIRYIGFSLTYAIAVGLSGPDQDRRHAAGQRHARRDPGQARLELDRRRRGGRRRWASPSAAPRADSRNSTSQAAGRRSGRVLSAQGLLLFAR